MTTTPAIERAVQQTQGTRVQLPSSRAVLLEQVRTTGHLLRIPIVIAMAAAVLLSIFVAIQIASGAMPGNLHAEPSAAPGVIGALLPIVVWAREERFGPGFVWTLPVDRSRHALIKVLAGWLWLMGGVALYALCQLVIALVTDGQVLPVETLHLLPAPVTTSGPLDPASLRIVQWAPGPVIWAVPFVAATATYLLASAIMLGIRHPLRWLVGAVIVIPVASAASHVAGRATGVEWLSDAPSRAISQLVAGRYGLDMLLKLRTWTLDRMTRLTTGERIEAWSSLPDLGDWGVAALLWTGVGLLALLAAASRHRERRRG